MLLKNTGEKIINVGKDILMPGESREFPDGSISHNTLATLIGMGFLEVSMKKKTAPVKKAEPETVRSPFAKAEPEAEKAEPAKAEASPFEAEEPVEEKKPVRKSSRK